MTKIAKYQQLAELVQNRLKRGDYEFCTIPAAHKLADEMGVSYLTARQAIQTLITNGVLIRKENGRLEAAQTKDRQKLKVALILPAMLYYSFWPQVLRSVAGQYNIALREISYCYDDDPLLFDALNGDFDLIILNCNRTDPLFIDKLIQLKSKIVTLFNNLTNYGIPLLDGITPAAISQLINYLYSTGCRKIDCFNTQPATTVVAERRQQWHNSLTRLGCRGEFYNYPVTNHTSAPLHAYQVSSEILAQGGLSGDAAFCISVECALGLLRSCRDWDIAVPEQLSVVAFGHLNWARVAIPSITVVSGVDPERPIRELFEHFTGVCPQPGRLIFRKDETNCLHIGESTKNLRAEKEKSHEKVACV